jgi:methionyl-tRNA synthetase
MFSHKAIKHFMKFFNLSYIHKLQFTWNIKLTSPKLYHIVSEVSWEAQVVPWFSSHEISSSICPEIHAYLCDSASLIKTSCAMRGPGHLAQECEECDTDLCPCNSQFHKELFKLSIFYPLSRPPRSSIEFLFQSVSLFCIFSVLKSKYIFTLVLVRQSS